MDLENRLSRLKGEILAMKRDLDVTTDPLSKETLIANDTPAISYKLDTLISEYLRVKDKIQILQEKGKL